MVIPAGDSNAEVVGEITMATEAKLVYVQPHVVHLRRKDYELRLIYPTETQVVFKGKFDFNWQLGYYLQEPILVRATLMVGIF